MKVQMRPDSEPLLNRRGRPKQRGTKFSPVIHVLYPDGGAETYKRRPIALPEDDSGGIYSVLMTRDGIPYVDPVTRTPVIFAVPPIMFGGAKEQDDAH